MGEFQEGEGSRACRTFDELTKYNPINVYITCLGCEYEWNMNKQDWLVGMPYVCPDCGGQALAHEYAVPNAIKYRWKRKDTKSPLKLVPITDPVRGTIIRRIVRVQSII